MSELKPSPMPPSQDLEIKDAQLIFHRVWKDLELDYGHDKLHFPKELILLGGAPGSGKGTHTDFIRKVRGITAQPIVMSQLLLSPEARKIKAAGGMVGDEEVLRLLLREMLKPEYRESTVLDGFPRTGVQVECLKLLYDQMLSLRREFYHTRDAHHYKQPIFHIMVLFVDEAESVARQLKRGRETIEHNEEVRQSGVGELLEERVTDLDPDLARSRYRVFKKQTYHALVSLKQIFHYHFINAQASIETVQQNIIRELDYQSSLELDPRTFDTLRHIPLADEIVKNARQELVNRLDGYEIDDNTLFRAVVDFIQHKTMPIIQRYAVSGRAMINSEDILLENPLALTMLIDIFSERGFRASVDIRQKEIPVRFDLQTGLIETRRKKVFRITILFAGSTIRRG